MTFNLSKNTLGKCDLGVVGYVSHHGWLGNRLRVKLGVTNLTDTERDQVATDLDYIQKSRSIYAGVTASF